MLRVAGANGEVKLKMTLENAGSAAAATFWKSEADKTKLKDADYLERVVNDLTLKDAWAKKGSNMV